MAFWDFLFGKKTSIIEDFYFGEIKDCNDHFEGKKFFKPTNTIIDFFIPNETIEPYHKTFFKDLEEKYHSLIPQLKHAFEDDFFKNMDSDFEIKDFEKEFTLSFILLPNATSSEWEISFETIHDENHSFTGCFIGMELDRTNIDG
jgi:hypothetical protein